MDSKKRAEQDLNYKLRLEKRLKSALKNLFSKFVSDFYHLLVTERRLDFDQIWYDDFRKILLTHYKYCEDVFSKNYQRQTDAVATESEKNSIHTNLKLFFALEAQITAKELHETTRQNMKNAKKLADIERKAHEEETGTKMATATFALIATNLFRQYLNRRMKTVSVTETQKATETAKFVEIEVLKTSTTTINNPGSSLASMGTKDWFAVLDNVTRPDHVVADRTQHNIPSNKPFIVGGYKMMYPGDRSLGAPIKQWINCRCICIYS